MVSFTSIYYTISWKFFFGSLLLIASFFKIAAL